MTVKDTLNLLLSIALFAKCNLGGSATEHFRPYMLILYKNHVNGRSGLHLNPKCILILEYRMSYGSGTTVSTKHNYDNIVHKAFLNGPSSCKQTSNILFKTEMAQLDKEERENNIRL